MRMKNVEFRALLDLFMCSDPYPCEGHDTIETLLEIESMHRGFRSWVDAYHGFKVPA